MSTVISVENLSKTYHLGQIGTGTFSNDLKVWWAKARSKPNPLLKIGQADHGNRDGEELCALKDINFKVEQGQVLGIIGRNGAGKSTLLKILSRVTAPTSGKIKVKGKIASLLEVGTGFHPELSGRENIYLNAAILGMSRQEVTSKFNEIVHFAEVEKFIDTPVKRYSSGMYVRLAFAVAAHLEPEILLVDEVLAVGDARFQKKCLSKMGDVSRAGRTVLFVSHNMTAVQSICQRALMLDDGRLVEEGPVPIVISRYLHDKQTGNQQGEWGDPRNSPGNDVVRIKQVRIIADNVDGDLTMQSPLQIETVYWMMKNGVTIHITFHLINDLGVTVLTTGVPSAVSEEGSYKSICSLPANLLNSGDYFLKLLIVEDENRVTYINESIFSFTVHDTSVRSGAWMGREPGVVQPILPWHTEKLSDN